jgi:SAM-dependent methyltransferase
MVSVSGVEPENAKRGVDPKSSSGAPDAVIIKPVRRDLGANDSLRASRTYWESAAGEYQEEHGEFLGDADFMWCPERLREGEAGLLGDVSGRRVLEVGAGAAQCSRWLIRQGADPVGIDVSAAQLAIARGLDRRTGIPTVLVQADAQRLPFAASTFDLACSAYGAVPFVVDSAGVMREVARVLMPGGRWVFSVTHPIRWCFPDDPGPGGLLAQTSYFDRRPYVELDFQGAATYVEHHRTIGDRIREAVAAGLVIDDIVEPEWPADHGRPWGQWSPLRGEILPGTAIFVTHKPGETTIQWPASSQVRPKPTETSRETSRA